MTQTKDQMRGGAEPCCLSGITFTAALKIYNKKYIANSVDGVGKPCFIAENLLYLKVSWCSLNFQENTYKALLSGQFLWIISVLFIECFFSSVLTVGFHEEIKWPQVSSALQYSSMDSNSKVLRSRQFGFFRFPWFIVWVLWHINLCRLFNAKSILYK